MNEPLIWTKGKLKKAWINDEIAGISYRDDYVRFVLKDGVTWGYLGSGGAPINFKSEGKAWAAIDKIKGTYND